MTHYISHEYEEILFPAMPGLEIHVVYDCQSEICFDDNGDEESNRLLTISASVNGVRQDLVFMRNVSKGQSEDVKRFLAMLCESARQALHAHLLREGLNELGKPAQSFVE